MTAIVTVIKTSGLTESETETDIMVLRILNQGPHDLTTRRRSSGAEMQTDEAVFISGRFFRRTH